MSFTKSSRSKDSDLGLEGVEGGIVSAVGDVADADVVFGAGGVSASVAAFAVVSTDGKGTSNTRFAGTADTDTPTVSIKGSGGT
jgi:poly(3-hydroxybutyrate) depolymerase